MKNNIHIISSKSPKKTSDEKIDLPLNDLSKSDIDNLRASLNKLRNLSNKLKEKNNIIDGILLSTKKRNKILIKETNFKEDEITKLENEINISFNKLFSGYCTDDIKKTRILTKLRFLRTEFTQTKYLDYLEQKRKVEQKEDKMQRTLCLLTTEQLEKFNKEMHNKRLLNNDEEKQRTELINKQYEDIKKTEIFKKIIGEIKESLSNESLKSKKKFNSKLLNLSQNNIESKSSMISGSQGNYCMRSDMFSNKNRKRANRSLESKNIMNNESIVINEENNATQKYLINNKKYGPKSFASNNSSVGKKAKRFNSKFFNK